MKQHEVSLETLAGGAAPARFDRELAKKVIPNIMDPNTDPEKERVITLKVTFKPNQGRTSLNARIEVDSKLAPPRPVDAALHVGEIGERQVLVGYDPQQPSLFKEDQDEAIKPVREKATHSEEE